jgi:hypothetical protein
MKIKSHILINVASLFYNVFLNLDTLTDLRQC